MNEQSSKESGVERWGEEVDSALVDPVWFWPRREFISACGLALDLNGRLIEGDQFEYQENMRQNFREMVTRLQDILDEQVSEPAERCGPGTVPTWLLPMRGGGGSGRDIPVQDIVFFRAAVHRDWFVSCSVLLVAVLCLRISCASFLSEALKLPRLSKTMRILFLGCDNFACATWPG